MDHLTLSREQFRQMVEQCLAERPNEACGLIFGHGPRADRVVPMRNVAASPSFYNVDPLEQTRVIDQFEKDGFNLLAQYHSHVRSPAWPSPTDVELAYWEDNVHLIVSLHRPDPEARAFVIREGRVTEIPLEVREN